MTSYAGGPFQRVQLQITDLSSEQLATLTSNPPVFVPAPGPGHALAFLAAYVLTNPGTIPFFNAQAQIGYAGDGEVVENAVLNFTTGSANALFAQAHLLDKDFPTPFVNANTALIAVNPSADDPSGAVLAFSIASGGLLYAPGDTVTIDSFANSVFVVDTVDGGGGVLTGHFTNRGFNGVPGVGLSTTVLTGSGDGNLTITVTTVTPANGTARVWVYYMVVELP